MDEFDRIEYIELVNHRTYLNGPASKGTEACTKRPSELISRVGVEIRILMDRLTNLNPNAGSEVPHPPLDLQGLGYCVLYHFSKEMVF